MQYYLQALQRKSMSRIGVLQSVLRSSEFRSVRGLPVHPLNALHQARMMVVQRLLPPAQIIVDLGGAARDHPEGALLAMGYPYRPHRVIVVDLPPERRIGTGWEHTQSLITADGVHISYHYGSMSDLSFRMGGSVDLVWAGQSIEHVTEAEAEVTCREAFRVLRPGGYFCLDTPNAVLTRLQSPKEMIHPEHKKEYCVHEMVALLERVGFRVLEGKGICPMPHSLQTGIFDQAEITRNIGFSDRPEEGYLFFLKAIKPG